MVKSCSGLTLVETTIAVGISAVIGVLLLSLLVNNTGLFYSQTSKVQQGVGANDALNTFRSNTRSAVSVVNSYTDGSTSFVSSSNVLVIKLLSVNASGNLIANTYDYFVYHSVGGIFYQRVFADVLSDRKSGGQVLASNVKAIFFEYFNVTDQEVIPTSAAKVRLTLTLQQKIGLDLQTNIATSEASFRND